MSKQEGNGDQEDKFEYRGFTITHDYKLKNRKFVNHMIASRLIKNQDGEDKNITVEATGDSYEEVKQQICEEIDLINESNN